ncbi:MAG TPA: prepilin-type N-terminal cleavage/methylation domain-containing protein [Lacipirellulaceae bacterium]|nr:prepilin-type N-terminal cleavage/methylation domain-containing protein [Lacipirellulaceae bacterium]HMP06400.1 prepilin-type N-terminal cleavage/methylation domain-containing protein [Lacipirellulaceae bacterium]
MRRQRTGFSLVEMMAATALMAGTLAPALSVMRSAMAMSREAATRSLVANYAVQTLEAQSALAMQNWTNGTATGNFAGDGYPLVKFIAVRSDAPSNGGLTNRLMHIQVTAYEDVNGNSAADAGELKFSIRTKVARLNTYIHAPN